MAFPTWPPPSGGYPVTQVEQSPKINPFPYGKTQPTTINANPPLPPHPWPATFFPKSAGTAVNGQNQKQSLPTWPHAKFNTMPDKASPSYSQLP